MNAGQLRTFDLTARLLLYCCGSGRSLVSSIYHMREDTLEKKRSADRESTAYHEAGHAVIAYLLDCYADHCSIKPVEFARGFALRSLTLRRPLPGAVDFNPAERPPDAVSLPGQLAHLYAGVVAQRLLCIQQGVSPDSIRPSHDMHSDIHTAQGLVNNRSEAEQIELLHSAKKQAMVFLTDPHNWQLVERIATKLLEVEELDRHSLSELLSESQDTLF